MTTKQLNLFDEQRLSQSEAVDITADYLNAYFSKYNNVSISYSGGKDSSALVSTVIHLIEQGKVTRPKELFVIYADTRMELPPLHASAMAILQEVEKRGFKTKIATASLDKRFLVYILGRGVPPPNGTTLRWCTQQIKVTPMMKALADVRSSLAPNERLLMLTGVRLGESAVRDRRILASCTKNGSECGQGWFQNATFENTDTLAPIIHWGVCQIWDWLIEGEILHGFPTYLVAAAYGGDKAQELNARTGCMGCPLASRDLALDNIIEQEDWSYLKPVSRLRDLYTEWRNFANRHQKNDFSKRQAQKGPLTIAARLKGLENVLAIQQEVNVAADRLGRPRLDILNAEEETRIRELIGLGTYPNGWDGNEPTGDVLLPQVYGDGSIQPLLWEVEV
jgi:DNA sulfur modification protein DndC